MGTLLNDNVFGIALQFASGIPVNLRTVTEINNDATASDRPDGVSRNSLNLPARYNVDFRYSRRFRIRGSTRGGDHRRGEEHLQHRADLGRQRQRGHQRARRAAPARCRRRRDQLMPTGGYEQRQFQLGFKFTF